MGRKSKAKGFSLARSARDLNLQKKAESFVRLVKRAYSQAGRGLCSPVCNGEKDGGWSLAYIPQKTLRESLDTTDPIVSGGIRKLNQDAVRLLSSYNPEQEIVWVDYTLETPSVLIYSFEEVASNIFGVVQS